MPGAWPFAPHVNCSAGLWWARGRRSHAHPTAAPLRLAAAGRPSKAAGSSLCVRATVADDARYSLEAECSALVHRETVLFLFQLVSEQGAAGCPWLSSALWGGRCLLQLRALRGSGQRAPPALCSQPSGRPTYS